MFDGFPFTELTNLPLIDLSESRVPQDIERLKNSFTDNCRELKEKVAKMKKGQTFETRLPVYETPCN